MGTGIQKEDAPVQTLLASAARTVSGNSGNVIFPRLDYAQHITFEQDITVASGTTPTLDVVVATSLDGGTNFVKVVNFSRSTATGQKWGRAMASWFDTPAGELVPATVANLVVGTTYSANNIDWSQIWVVKWAIGGTTPSFTFSIKAYPFYGT